MNWFGARSIKAKLSLLVALASGCALLLACAAFLINDYSTVRQSTVQHFAAVAAVLGSNTVAPLTFQQPDPATEVLESLRFEPQVEFAGVYDRSGQLFAQYERAELAQPATIAPRENKAGFRFTKSGRLVVTTRIQDADGPVGMLVLVVGMDHLHAQMRQHLLAATLVLAVSLCVSQLASTVLQKRIAGPILELAKTAGQISANRDYSVRVVKPTEDELGDLYDAFNRMLNEIQEGERQLRKAHEDLEQRVVERTQQLTVANRELASEIAERELAEKTVRALQQRHLEAARRAGMADVATGVLHNVGNVLNSVNVSVNLARDKLANSRVTQLGKVVGLLSEHRQDLPTYLATDERGKRLPDFLEQLSGVLAAERDTALEELGSLERCVEHIREVVTMQQSFAAAPSWTAPILASELMDDAVKLNDANLMRHGISMIREYDDVGEILTDRHKVLQILINLLSNAKHALKDSGQDDRRIILSIKQSDGRRIRFTVTDNGVGIPQENLTRIFNHGFTTKKDGHGFGLHSAALAATELGGSLNVTSAGLGQGASFTLELPVKSPEQSLCPV